MAEAEKKMLSTESSPSYSSHGEEPPKKQKMSVDLDVQKEVFQSPYSPFNLLSQQRKPFQFSSVNHSPPTTYALPFAKECMTDATKTSPLHPPSWPALHGMFPTYNLLWNNPFVQGFRGNFRESMMAFKGNLARRKEENFNDDESSSSAGNSPCYDDSNERFSAFRLVNQTTRKDSVSSPKISSNSSDDEEINITDIANNESMSDAIDLECKLEDKVSEDLQDKSCNTTKEQEAEDGPEKKMSLTKNENKSPIDANGSDNCLTTSYGGSSPQSNQPVAMTKEEIQKEVQAEMEIRRQMEREIQALKEALTNELEQERQVRFSLQQKLKEAHDALHNFSCKMLASRKCDECEYKEGEKPLTTNEDS